MKALVSIIVPVYNTKDYLPCCLDSILHQTYKNLEILLIDDGSTDGSGGICDKYAASDGRIQVLHQRNGGLSDARNQGLGLARGEYIAFVDSDDYIHERYIELLLEGCVRGGCEVGIVRYQKVFFNHCRQDVGDPVQMECVTGIQASLRMYEDSYSIMTATAWGKIFQKRLFNGIRFPMGRIYEDEAVTYKLLYDAEKVVYIDAVLYYYRQNWNGIMLSGYSARHLQYFDAMQERLEFYRRKQEQELYDLTLNRTFFQVITHYNKTRLYIEHSEDLQKELRKKLRQLYFLLLKRDSFPIKRKLRYTWALFFPVRYYKKELLAVFQREHEVIQM